MNNIQSNNFINDEIQDTNIYNTKNNSNLNKMNNIESINNYLNTNIVPNNNNEIDCNTSNDNINDSYVIPNYNDLNSNNITNYNDLNSNQINYNKPNSNISGSYILPNYDTKIINPSEIPNNKQIDIKKIQDNILNNDSLNNTNIIKGIDGITERDNNDKFLGEIQNSQIIREDKQVKFNNNLCDINDPNYNSSLCYLNGTNQENNAPINFNNNYIINNEIEAPKDENTKINLNNNYIIDNITDINIENKVNKVGNIINVESLNNIGMKQGSIYNPQKELLDRLNDSKIDDCSNVTDTWQDDNLNDFINQSSKELLINSSNININNSEYLNKSISEIYDELTNVEFQKIPNEFGNHEKIGSNSVSNYM